MDPIMTSVKPINIRQTYLIRYIGGLFLLLSIGLLTGCASLTGGLEPPLVTVANIEPLPSQGFAPQFKVVLELQNRNNQPLNLGGLDFDLEVDGRRFASGVSATELTLQPLSRARAEVNVTINGFSLARQLFSWMQTTPDALAYEISGHLHLQQGLMRRLAFSQKGELSFNGEQ